jgi:coatomer protein complex subunit gamma
LAVSILLKICKEDNIEKLLGQIYEYLSEMSDEFKIDILRSVRALVHQNPKKWKATLAFLS